jgi:hypothetical protein
MCRCKTRKVSLIFFRSKHMERALLIHFQVRAKNMQNDLQH